MRMRLAAASIALLFISCGGADPVAEGRPVAGGAPAAALRVTLAAVSVGSVPVTLAIRNLFDAAPVVVVDCSQTDALSGPQSFCDQLVVVPPGAYEIVARPDDPTCRTDQQSYLAVVRAGETLEIQIHLICGRTVTRSG